MEIHRIICNEFDDDINSALLYATLTEEELQIIEKFRNKATAWWGLIPDYLWVRITVSPGEHGTHLFNGYGDELKILSTVMRFFDEQNKI